MTNKDKVKKRAVLSQNDKHKMMSVVIRNKDVFEFAKDELTTEHFNETEAILQLGWGVVLNYFEEYEELPDRDLMYAEVQSLLDQDEDLLTDTEFDDINTWIDESYDESATPPYNSPKYTKWGLKTLRRFLEERLARRIQQSVALDDRVVGDLPGLLDTLKEESDRVAQIGMANVSATFTPDWDKDGGIQLRSTGCTFFDDPMNGGHAPGECYGLLGPFGSCKTTTGLMLAVNACRFAVSEEVSGEWDGERSLAFFVSYEARLENEIRLRTLSYAARIRRKSLEKMGKDGLSALSTTGDLLAYEKKQWAADIAAGELVKGEQERAAEAIEMLNRHLRVLDMTGYDANARGAGDGFIEEIARRIGWELRRAGNAKTAIVVIDYVGAMARRHLGKVNKDESHLRHLISGAGLKARNLIADQFHTPAWLLHQLSGQANEKSPGAKLDHTHSAESKSFAENLDYAFVVGKLTDENLCQIVNTKHRRSGSSKPEVLQVVGEFNRVESRKDKYTVNQSAGKIQLIGDATAAVSQEQAAQILNKGGVHSSANLEDEFNDDEMYNDEPEFDD